MGDLIKCPNCNRWRRYSSEKNCSCGHTEPRTREDIAEELRVLKYHATALAIRLRDSGKEHLGNHAAHLLDNLMEVLGIPEREDEE